MIKDKNKKISYVFLFYFIAFTLNLTVLPLDLQRVTSLFFGGICLLFIGEISEVSINKVFVLLAFFFFCSSAVINSQEVISFGVILKYVDYFIFTILMLLVFENINKKIFYNSAYGVFIIVGLMEIYIRYLMPEVALSNSVNSSMIEGIQDASLSEDSFYFFKFASILRFDSNGVAVVYVCLLSVLLVDAYKYVNSKVYPLLIFSLLAIILFTLSRAGILSAGILLFLYRYSLVRTPEIKLFFLLLSLLILLLLTPSLIEYFLMDESGSTKIEVFNNLIVVVNNMDLIEKLFGFGISIDPYNLSINGIYGHTGHAWLFLSLCYFGLFGVVVFTFVFLQGIIISNSYIIGFSFLVISLSYLEPLEPLFIFLILMLNTNLRDKNEESITFDK